MNFDINQVVSALAVGAIPVLFAITLHEVAHGWAARQLGDRTAEILGRLSLNPLKHVDPIGTLVVPLLMFMFSGFLFGWAKPVPVAFRNLRRPKTDMVWVALAGPAANVVMGIGWALVLKLSYTVGPAGDFLSQMAEIGLLINILLAAFNLLPIPPLDGGRVVRGLVGEGFGNLLDRIEPFGLIIIVLLLVTDVLWFFVQPLIAVVRSLILIVAGL